MMIAGRICIVLGVVTLHPRALLAHDGRPTEPHDLWMAWTLDPVTTLPLLMAVILFVVGTRRLTAALCAGGGL